MSRYTTFEQAQKDLEKRSDTRVCSFMGFGKDKAHVCNCKGDEIQWCRDNYDQIKKEQYVDSKGQHSFNDK